MKSEYVKYEEWQDYWCFKPKEEFGLETFRQFNISSWKTVQEGLKIIIESEKEIAKPSHKQVITLDYIRAHQTQILHEIFSFHQALIFPLYKDNIDIEDHQIINKESQTNTIYSIESVTIPLLEETESTYFILNLNFQFDDEHDMSFLFRNNSIIDFTGLGDDFIDYIELYENKLSKGNDTLSISVYDHPNRECVFSDKYSISENINFHFENRMYTIGIYREKWPQSFRAFYFPKKPVNQVTLNQILDTTHNKP